MIYRNENIKLRDSRAMIDRTAAVRPMRMDGCKDVVMCKDRAMWAKDYL